MVKLPVMLCFYYRHAILLIWHLTIFATGLYLPVKIRPSLDQPTESISTTLPCVPPTLCFLVVIPGTLIALCFHRFPTLCTYFIRPGFDVSRELNTCRFRLSPMHSYFVCHVLCDDKLKKQNRYCDVLTAGFVICRSRDTRLVR